MTHAAHWLFNHREPRPFARILLHWRGWTTRDGLRRRMSRRRESTERTLLDDIARIFRETNAEQIYVEGMTHTTSYSRRTLGWCRRFVAKNGTTTFHGPEPYQCMLRPE